MSGIGVKKVLKEHLIERKGNYIIRRTEKQRIVSLIHRLHPIKTEYDLIRVGPNGDGGYLLPDHLSGIKACFSPGVDTISEFEQQCHEFGMEIYMADKTVEKPNIQLAQNEYNFIKKHLACFDTEETITLENWVKEFPDSESDLLLQMDIEGAEYEVILSTSVSLMKRFRMMLIEFHNLNDFWNPGFFRFAEMGFNKILNTHTCVHIHPNNCCGIDERFDLEIPRVAEFTFMRNGDFKSLGFQKDFPHALDLKNTQDPDIILPTTWYSLL